MTRFIFRRLPLDNLINGFSRKRFILLLLEMVK